MLDGVVQVLSGTEIVRAERGDVIVVAPRLPHAFSADRDSGADLLIVIAPGIERYPIPFVTRYLKRVSE